jgi:para-nitrobenzyl esterase
MSRKIDFCRRVSGFAMTAILISGLFIQTSSAGAEQNLLTVKTKSGKVMGKAEGAVREFLGIPYAQPPVGALRWKPPMPAAKWKGVRPATEFGSHCMQLAVYKDMVFRDPGISEDCLTLNVWTPANDAKAKLPVMVWIYGGGFAGGGSSEPRQDGANLAKNGVIVVSMNYRLGVFGFFAHPDLTAESPNKASGNYGLMDQTAALKWVHDNIAAFGGDPAKVTLFGESAGSFSVSSQMASPLAKGLFIRAIGESGGAFSISGLTYKPLAEVEAQDADFAKTILSATTVAQLRAMPAQQLLEAKPPQGVRFGPDVDGYFLPESVPAIFAAKKQNDVALLAGWNRDEGGVLQKTTVDSFKAEVEKDFGPKSPEFLTLFPASTDEEAVRSASDLAAARFIAFSTWKWLEAAVTDGTQPVYRFRFDWVTPEDQFHPGGIAAYHSSEIPYVFGALDLMKGYAWRPEDYKVSELMQKYWSNFAKTGDPNGEGLPKWPTYNGDSGWQVMHLTPEPMAEADAQRNRYLFLNEQWTKASSAGNENSGGR